ncbi:MAG TPA: DNA polymerase III subunit epsilon [Steroidobacteraceae bacterium]|nr:DNA polymerase III subunit epsilon [Steroidobacteraceae bacterium]
MRQIVLDTETTGLEVERGHRIIEIGAVELRNRRATGRNFHRYLNPERAIDEGARAVHGISSADLADAPRFAQVAAELIEFISGAELVIHNASFDVGFLEAELQRLPESSGLPRRIGDLCGVLDTLALAREMHPGQRNSLDALCRRYGIDNSHRELHGALLDARILADVYLTMTGGQSTLALDSQHTPGAPGSQGGEVQALVRPAAGLVVRQATAAELADHERMLDLIARASGDRCVFRQCDVDRVRTAANRQ